MNRRMKDSSPDPLIRVIAAVVSRGNDLLVCQRPIKKRHGGLWEFPGGKCEDGESAAAAVRRELNEELGVDVVEIGKEDLAIRDPDSSYLIIFTPVRIIGEPTCREHLEIRWAPLNELAQLPLAPADRQYVNFRLGVKSDS